MTIPEWDFGSPLLAKWLQKELDNRDMTTAQFANKMHLSKKTIHGLLAAAKATSKEAITWMADITIEVSLILGLPWNTAFKILKDSPAHQEISWRCYVMKKRSNK